VLFSAAGAGGVEGIASGAARQALRESLRGTARNALRESLMAGGKGMLGEMAEEQIITALDAALVQAELRPGMTAEDFQRAVYETAVVTFISSGGFAVAHGRHAYNDTLASNARIGTETAADGDGALTTMNDVEVGGVDGMPPAISDSVVAPPQQSSPPNPPDNPFRTPEGRLPIKPQFDPTVDPDLAAKEAEFIETFNRPLEEVDAAYDAIHDEFESSHGGKVISTDLPRKMLKDFAATKEGRERYTAITTAGARAYGRDRLWREIYNRGGRRKLMFTAGGIAAGKSSVVNEEVIAAQDLVYDATLRETAWAIRNIEKAIEMGWEVRIVYVQRPIELALQGAVHRAAQQGRSFPLADLPAAHRDAQRSIVEIAKRFGGNPQVEIQLWLNSGKNREAPTELSLQQIDKPGEYSYEHISHAANTRGTERMVGSDPQSGDQRLHEDSPDRRSALDAFQRAIGRKDLSREVLSGLAGKDPELQRILKESGK
jgi:hypothetical protein